MSEQPVTISFLLETIEKYENGLLAFDPKKQAELGDQLKDKIDNYFTVLERFDCEIARIKAREEELAQTRRSLTNNRDGLKNWIQFQMKSRGYEKLPGKDTTVSLVKRQSVEYTLPNAPDALTARKWPTFVTHTYGWDKKALSEAIKASPEEFKELGHLSETEYLKFSIRKDLR